MYAQVWELMQQGYNPREIGEIMTERGEPTPGGKEVWGKSAEKVVSYIKSVADRFFGERGLDFESLVAASRKRGFRFGAASKRQVEAS